MKSPSKLVCAGMAAAVLNAAPSTSQAADYTYTGAIITDMAGASCRPAYNNAEGATVFREFGALVLSNSFTGVLATYYCPLTRRNTTLYGNLPTSVDRVRMNSLRVALSDGTTSSNINCYGFVGSALGGLYFSTTRYACGSTNGCTSPPPASYAGTNELYWSNPFGSTAISNQGAVNVGYICNVPKNSMILWARAAYQPN